MADYAETLTDLETIGEKIVEMADMVTTAETEKPGAQARWVFEMNGTLYRVVVTIDERMPKAGEACH